MDRLESLQLFTRIVELNSFSRAAASLDIPASTATHAIKELEGRLGTRLLDRTTRQVRPTLDGKAFYERCIRVLSDLDDAESSFRHVASNPQGVLRVDMQGAHAARIILPRIDEFRARYPHINFVTSTGDRLVDLVREGVDCVVRSGGLRDSSLVARRLASMQQVICASREYVAKFGQPTTPEALSTHHGVKFFSPTSSSSYPFELVIDGEVREFPVNGWMSVSDSENYVICAMRGCGLIQLPRYHVEDALLRGELVEVLPTWEKPDLPLSALYPYHRHLSPRVRVFIDWLAEIYQDKFGPLPDALRDSGNG